MYSGELFRFSENHKLTKEWYKMKTDFDDLIESLIVKSEYSDEYVTELENMLGKFVKLSDEVQACDEVVDWYKYYIEYQIAIYYYAYLDFKKEHKFERFQKCKKETRTNQNYAEHQKSIHETK